MRLVVTGAGGFVGRRVVDELADHVVVAIDNVAERIPDRPHVIPMAGDLCDANFVATAMADGCDAVVHLATVPGGAAEQDPELARRVNVDATMTLAAKAAVAGLRPQFVFASSIAVYGESLPASVDDSTPLAPKMLYGAHKAMIELWLATMTRRAQLDVVSLRLSGVVARPRAPSGLKSAFVSNVFHALKAGEQFVMPVSAEATIWLTSVDCVANNIAHALSIKSNSAPESRAILLPALQVRVSDLVSEIADQAGHPASLVSYAADAAVEEAFGGYPSLATPTADRLGFAHDGNLASLVERAFAQLATS